MRLGNRLGDAQPQPDPLLALVTGRSSTIEALEDLRLLLWRDAYTGVCDAERGPGSTALEGEDHLATGWRVLEAVIHQVQQQLSEALWIPLDSDRH